MQLYWNVLIHFVIELVGFVIVREGKGNNLDSKIILNLGMASETRGVTNVLCRICFGSRNVWCMGG